MNENKRLIKNTSIIAFGNISTKLVSFLLLPLYTALLSTEEYGTFDYIISIATFCVPIVTVLMDESIFRFLIDAKDKKERSIVISTAFYVVTVGAILFVVIAFPIMSLLRYQYMWSAIIYVLLSAVSGMISALLRGIGRTDQYAVFNFLNSILQIALNILFIAVFHWGVLGMLRAAIFAFLIVSILFVIYLRLWNYVSVSNYRRTLAKEMVRYSLPLIPNKISWSIINLSDRIIIMNTIGSASSGLYAISYKFPTLMDTVYGFFYQAWKESSARVLGEESQNEFYNSVYDALKNFMYSVVIGMIAFMPMVFKLLINQSYHNAILYVPILLFGTYFANISGFYGGIFTAYKDTKIMGTTTVIAAFINLVVNISLIAKIGLYAAAFSTLVANIIVFYYRRYKVRKYVLLREQFGKSILSLIVTGIVLMLFYMGDFKLYVVNCLIALIYAIVINRRIINSILEYIKKKIKKA